MKHDRIPELMKNAVIAAEDKRFYWHFGFDPLATSRAIYSYYTTGKIVSGASTISQQVVRMLQPRPRTFRSKIIEFFAAIKLEWQLSKDEILELILNLAPMGGYLKGVGIASLVYFDKEPQMLSVSEAAALAALPRSPSRFDPSKPRGRLLLIEEKDRVISRMLSCGFISRDEAERSKGRNITFRKRRIPRQASHFTSLALRRNKGNQPVVETTLDCDVQKILEEILDSHRSRLNWSGIKQAAGIIISSRDLGVEALMGSINFSATHGGFNNGAIAKRSGGSTLKPFLYALALSQGLSETTVIADTARSYKTPAGDYIPFNANRIEHGPVTVSEALGSSLNLAAMKAMEKVGVSNFFDFLTRVKLADDPTKEALYYGYGLALGNLDVSLFRLTQAYGCLARQGNFGELRLLSSDPLTATRLMSPKAVETITMILSDHNARLLAFGNPYFFNFGFRVAIKTGTSDGYRDAWTLAFTSEHIIGLWAGNFDGTPSPGISGSAACGPILKDLVVALYGARAVPAAGFSGKHEARPEPVNVADHSYLGPEYASWLHRRELDLGSGRYRLANYPQRTQEKRSVKETDPVDEHFLERVSNSGPGINIVSPHDKDRFSYSADKELLVPLKALPNETVPYVIWIVNGVEIARSSPPYEFFWKPERGNHSILAVTPQHEAAKIEIHVE
jgi:penicillin-binding protein 1C